MSFLKLSERSVNREEQQHHFQTYVASEHFPCVGARSAIRRNRAQFELYEGFGEQSDVERLCRNLEEFSNAFPAPEDDPVTFVAMFDDHVATEKDYERRLWCHLQRMHHHDRRTFEWDDKVSRDPACANFSFSVAGRAFFIVGLSPVASRIARRAPMPCIAFNFHDQFEHLRATGKFANFQRVIREREVALQGDINPMLESFGRKSEASQYSGRVTTPAWQCPFRAGTQNAS